MITNKFQYKLTRSQKAQFEEALQQLDGRAMTTGEPLHPLLQKAERDALQSQLESLQTEITDYEALRTGQHHEFNLTSFDELPQVLIRARIAASLTQKQLAERLGLKEQQIQRYEATGYASANFQRVSAVIRALGLQVREEFTLTNKTCLS